MNEETRNRLRDCLAFDIIDEFKYVPLAFRKSKLDKKLWPVFKLRTLNGIELSEIEDISGFISVDEHTGKREWHGNSGTARLEVLKRGLLGWKNYRNEKDKLIEYVDYDSIKFLRPRLQKELEDTILNHDVLTEDELRGLE